MTRSCLLAVALLCLAHGRAVADAGNHARWVPGDPLRVRNLSPATHLFGMPRPLGGLMTSGSTELSLTVEHSNNFTADEGDDVLVVFDGSTTVTGLTMRRGLHERWEWGLEVPFVHHGGGFTDGFIEDFHDLFGFPDGERDDVPRDELNYRIVQDGREVVTLTDEQRHVGDVRAWLGYRVHESTGRQAVLRAMVEAPTGRVKDLSGSGATDFAVWLEMVEHEWLAALNTTITLSGGVTLPGGNDLGLGGQRDAVATGHLGLHYALTPGVTLRAQLDGHTDVIASGAAPVAEAGLLGTLGGSVLLSRSLRLDLGVVEDLASRSAPDVVFLVALGARF